MLFTPRLECALLSSHPGRVGIQAQFSLKLPFWFPLVGEVPRAKCRRLCGLNNRTDFFFPHKFRCLKSKFGFSPGFLSWFAQGAFSLSLCMTCPAVCSTYLVLIGESNVLFLVRPLLPSSRRSEF